MKKGRRKRVEAVVKGTMGEGNGGGSDENTQTVYRVQNLARPND